MGFDLSTLQSLSTIAGGVGAVTGAIGSYNSGAANADAAMYQAAVARNNQTVAMQNAKYALDAGRVQEQAQRQKTAQMIGAQRAAMAANGIDISSGTPARIQESTGIVGELDALTIRNNAARQAYNYQVQAGDFEANAGMLDRTASNARTAGSIGAISSIVGGASGVADKWLKWKTPSTTSTYNAGGYSGSQWSDGQ